MADVTLTLTYPNAATALSVGKALCHVYRGVISQRIEAPVTVEAIDSASAAKIRRGVEIVFQHLAEEAYRTYLLQQASEEHITPIASAPDIGTVGRTF